MNKWISISNEKKPREYENVWVTYFPFGKREVMRAIFYKNFFYFDDNMEDPVVSVLAWMEQEHPAPYDGTVP